MTTTYTHIIVGGGSAGCVLANRLSADPNRSVLLLEAGGADLSPWIHLPLGLFYLIQDRNAHNWSFNADHEPGITNKHGVNLPRGRGLGGSSLINAQLYVRGVAEDYDAWVKMGLTDWSYDHVLPYFKKSERFHGEGNEFHANDGAMHVRTHQSDNELYDVFVDAAGHLQYSFKEDLNARVGLQTFRLQHKQNPKTGRRCSAKVAFLNPALDRPNLTVEKHAHARRLVIENGRAKGVVYGQNGSEITVYSDADVIVSCGTYQSPQLLMLSGIGPGDHLKGHGVTPVLDNDQVGANLCDHLGTGVQYASKRPITMASDMTLFGKARSLAQAVLTGKGPLTYLPFDAGMFAKSDNTLDRPDLMFYFGHVCWLGDEMQYLKDHGFTLAWQHMNPAKLGRVSLKSTNPLDDPDILHNYLMDEADMRAHRYALTLAREIVSQKSFDPYRGEEMLPGPNVTSQNDIDAYVRGSSETFYHPTGTCGMSADGTKVVDPELRVEGIENLRVVDASVFPTWTTANLQAPTLMIAEKASDIILGRPALAAQKAA